MGPIRKESAYIADVAHHKAPAPLHVRTRLALKELAEAIAAGRRADERLRARVMHALIVAEKYPLEPA